MLLIYLWNFLRCDRKEKVYNQKPAFPEKAMLEEWTFSHDLISTYPFCEARVQYGRCSKVLGKDGGMFKYCLHWCWGVFELTPLPNVGCWFSDEAVVLLLLFREKLADDTLLWTVSCDIYRTVGVPHYSTCKIVVFILLCTIASHAWFCMSASTNQWDCTKYSIMPMLFFCHCSQTVIVKELETMLKNKKPCHLNSSSKYTLRFPYMYFYFLFILF